MPVLFCEAGDGNQEMSRINNEPVHIPEERCRECEELFPGCRPGRVISEGTHLYRVLTASGEERSGT